MDKKKIILRLLVCLLRGSPAIILFTTTTSTTQTTLLMTETILGTSQKPRERTSLVVLGWAVTICQMGDFEVFKNIQKSNL